MARTTSDAGKLHIKQYENAKIINLSNDTFLESYWDSNGYAIGYGTRFGDTGQPIQKDEIVRKSYVEQLFNRDISAAESGLNASVIVTLTQGQFDALIDFIYQFGLTRFRSSTLLKVVNSTPNDYTAVATEFRKWVNVNGSPNTALQKRREANIVQYTGGGAVQSVTWIWVLIVAVMAVAFYAYRNK
ncbi:MAG: lysozyme [Spirosomataceae bacterium]